MATIREHLQKMPTDILQAYLRNYCNGDDYLNADTALIVCEVLSSRDETKPDVYDMLRKLCCTYLE